MKAGRKSKYKTHIEPNFDVILGWLRSGYTEESIAHRMGVGVSTWIHYKSEFQEFQEVIKKGQQDIAALCVNNLVKRAAGYDYEEITTEIIEGGIRQSENMQQESSQRRIIKKVTKHVPPDVAANCVILFNRMPKKWQNKQEIKHSGQIKNAGVLLTGPPLDKKSWLKFYEENVEKKSKQGQT